jgi:hypothetical protein
MFSFISSYFTGQKLNKNVVESYIYAISKKNNIEELNEIFENLLPNIPLDNYYSIEVYNELFSEFDYEQINIFSNNLCAKIEQKMKDNLDQLNYCTELLLNFTVSIFVRFNTIRELITKSYNNILENKNNENINTILSKSFPFNVVILCVNAITNEDFFFRKDIFQKEVDKFDFTYRLMNIIFCIVHICDSNFEKSSQSSIEFLDTIKLFLFLQDEKNVFISQENQKKFLLKLYNTSIHNFETLVNNKINPIIDKKKFEKFIFMNIYLLWYLLCDRNKNILNDMNSNNTNNKVKNTFNIKTISIIKKICEIKDSGIDDIINKYNNYFNSLILEELEKTNDKFMLFIQNVYMNLYYLSDIAQNLIKIIILYIFEIFPDFCEMICLKKELIGKILENIFPYNVYDLMILYRFSKSTNFYIAIKLAKITLEQMFLNCIINFLETKKNDKNKNNNDFEFILYFSLLTAKNFSKKLKYLSDLAIQKLSEFENYINNNNEINSENYYDNLTILILYYEIDYGIITSLDVPSKIIFNRLKSMDRIIKIINEYKEYYKNNLEYDEFARKDIWEKFGKVSIKYLTFFKNIIDEIRQSGLDIKLSNEEDVINIINRKSYKTSEDLIEDEKIFNHNVEKFIISSIHGNDLYKIYNY